MSEKFLHRDEAPFGPEVWSRIDAAVIGAAKGQLCTRRLLHTDGPYGLGLKAIPGSDTSTEEDDVTLTASGVVPVTGLQTTFRIPKRDIAAFESRGVPLNVSSAVKAAIACAGREDRLLLDGTPVLPGLATADGVQTEGLETWDEVGDAVENLIAAVTKLDGAGFHGPYALALSAPRYNTLFRRYPQGQMTELAHVRQIVTDGVVKAAPLDEGGILVASGRQFASVVLGQDLAVGFVGPDGTDYEFTISETLALRLPIPEAVCVLK